MSISIWESSTIPTLVFSEWTSTSSSEEPARELPEESTPRASSASTRESPLMRPSNGSLRRWLELSFDETSKPPVPPFVY